MIAKQTILITGATGNIGGGAAYSLAKRGARVVLLGRKPETLQARANLIRDRLANDQLAGQGADIATLAVDFSDMASVRLAAAEALSRFPEIHGLILSVVTLVQHGPNILPSGHELMFATNVMGPFLFTQLLLERMQQSDGLVLHVVNPSHRDIDWDDLESIRDHKAEPAYERTKVYHRMIAGEMARRYAGKISSVAWRPGTLVIDKTDPELKKRWPSGWMGFFWRMLTVLIAKPPEFAGEPIADLVLSSGDRSAINGALFKRDKRVTKPDKEMNDELSGGRLWDELVRLTGPTPEIADASPGIV